MASSPEAPQSAASLIRDRFAPVLVDWQRLHGRHDLPWQHSTDPYRVWLSEVMLQQTQVSTVLDYFARFLARFPDVQSLAAAPLDEVLALWAGLGYYSRARNLHRCAIDVVERFGGRFPRTAQELETLPGIGLSTASAIAAFCFGERAAILDGNVKRVLTRVLAYGGDLAEKRCERALWAAAQDLLPDQASDVSAYTQGLMDLGATLCVARRPQCERCPVQPLCAAFAADQASSYPVKSRKLKRSSRESWWLWLSQGQSVWLEQRPATGVWAGLWTLPLFDSEAELVAAAAAWTPGAGSVQALAALPPIDHVLTHLDWRLHTRRMDLRPACAEEPDTATLQPGAWVSRQELHRYALPAPLRRLLG